ncbi:MAG: thio(seleno)oxazole modification radical SAM maturase SbtM [Thermodesulfobacteriota bacterium]|nr:thio(seleno)oxazole modification radical SAM maturase SbtM [Thermodesulfobacteriota bacterium]
MPSFSSRKGRDASRAHPPDKEPLEALFKGCRKCVDSHTWKQIAALCGGNPDAEAFPALLKDDGEALALPAFLPELALLELTIHKVKSQATDMTKEVQELGVNPALELLQVSWRHLPAMVHGDEGPSAKPEPGDTFILVWCDPDAGHVRTRQASDEDLLVLKLVVEGIDPDEAAAIGGLPVGAVDSAIHRALHRGLLVAPPSGIRRDPVSFPLGEVTDQRFLSSPVFTLQWHITQTCDLHCKHCYDRANRSPLKLEDGLRLLDELRDFCLSRHVRGQISFTGGNPLLYPHFLELYQGASDRGLGMAILGNPAPRKRMEQLLAIAPPLFFQVSLEGLEKHNDTIRGPGNFRRVMDFLGLLQDLDITSMVMLTLTRDNMDQVLPLAEMLRGRTDHFNFNRLSMVGEGAMLHLPQRDAYRSFLEAYMEAAEGNPIMGLKDNLLNLLRYQRGMDLFGGCAGYGCSAAFNFMAVLSDGEVHACRKFPSFVGNVFEQSLAEIYDSEIACRYRSGCKGCQSCPIRPVCGGCLAIAHSFGHDIFEERDPYCFMELPLTP